jgi:prephenate dehydrogenase
MNSKNRNRIERIAVIGLGLLGGSLCKSLKQINPKIEITGYGRDINRLSRAREDGAVDRIELIERLHLKGVDFIVVATPVVTSVEIIEDILNRDDLEKETLVIDVGSVKTPIVEKVLTNRRSGQFVGCHPMAGSEESGYSSSSPDLYRGASVIITPAGKNSSHDIKRVEDFWRLLGAKTCIETPESHDNRVAVTSHLPHVVSCCLAEVLRDFLNNTSSENSISRFIGRGFDDMTRIASGSPVMWRDITLMNHQNISESINEMIRVLESFRELIQREGVKPDEIEDFFHKIKEFRDGLK